MVITHYGAQSYKLQTGDIVISINPVAKSSKYKVSRFGSDIALVSVNDEDFNGVENVVYGDKEPFVIKGAGEYEVKKIFIKGYGVKTSYKGREVINTIYTLNFDSINVCFLGVLAKAEDLTNEVKGKLGKIDILFVPVGGENTIPTADIYALAAKLVPSIIIPTQFEEKQALKTFIDESGGQVEKPVDKLTVKVKDFVDGESKVVILKSSC